MKPILTAAGAPRVVVRRALRLVFFIMLMDVIGITLLYPVSAYIVRRYSDVALHVTLLTVIYAAAQFFAAPVLGKLGDRFGRRPVLLVSLLGSAVGYVIFGIGGALWVLFLSRLIDGITAGNISTASACIADLSIPEERARNFGLIGAAWGVGLILGPALGAALGQLSLEAPALIAAALALLSTVLVYFHLPETLPKEQRQASALRLNDFNPFASIGAMGRRPILGRLLLSLCLFNFGFNGINGTQGLFWIERFGVQPWQLGLQLALAGITVVIVQAWLVPRGVARYGEQAAASISLLGQAVIALGFFYAPLFWLIFPLSVANTTLSTFTFPTLGTLASNRVLPGEQGNLMGVNTALSSLMSILGPLWAGIIYDRMMPGAPYWTSAAVFMIAAFLLKSTTWQKP